MKTLIKLISLLLLMTSFSSQARSPMRPPCPNTVEMMPSFLGCNSQGFFFNITIKTYHSDVNQYCSGESQIAIVKISNRANTYSEVRHYLEFDYELGGVDDGHFYSHDLSLEKCISPLHGGFSIGTSPIIDE